MEQIAHDGIIVDGYRSRGGIIHDERRVHPVASVPVVAVARGVNVQSNRLLARQIDIEILCNGVARHLRRFGKYVVVLVEYLELELPCVLAAIPIFMAPVVTAYGHGKAYAITRKLDRIVMFCWRYFTKYPPQSAMTQTDYSPARIYRSVTSTLKNPAEASPFSTSNVTVVSAAFA